MRRYLGPAFAGLLASLAPASAETITERLYAHSGGAVQIPAANTMVISAAPEAAVLPPPFVLGITVKETRPGHDLPFGLQGALGPRAPFASPVSPQPAPREDASAAACPAGIETFFALGSAALTPDEERHLLERVARHWPPDAHLKVDAYTCDLGSLDINESLAQARAATVKNLLEDRGYSVVALGTHPSSDYRNTDPSLRELNRRVVVARAQTH